MSVLQKYYQQTLYSQQLGCFYKPDIFNFSYQHFYNGCAITFVVHLCTRVWKRRRLPSKRPLNQSLFVCRFSYRKVAQSALQRGTTAWNGISTSVSEKPLSIFNKGQFPAVPTAPGKPKHDVSPGLTKWFLCPPDNNHSVVTTCNQKMNTKKCEIAKYKKLRIIKKKFQHVRGFPKLPLPTFILATELQFPDYCSKSLRSNMSSHSTLQKHKRQKTLHG